MPSVGHYANMSRHPKHISLAILEYVEDRLKEITEKLPGRLVGVYNPFNAEWDMLVILEVKNWKQYEDIYGAYFATEKYPLSDKQKEKLEIFKEKDEKVFSASSSKTVMYYTAKELRKSVFKDLPP
jgi:hypothetical protein